VAVSAAGDRGRIFGNADAPLKWLSNNGDVITVRAGAVTRMPDLILGLRRRDRAGGIFRRGGQRTGPEREQFILHDPNGAGVQRAGDNGVKNPAAEIHGGVGRGGGIHHFQAQDAWTITHELKLAPSRYRAAL